MKHLSSLALIALSTLAQAQSTILWQNTIGGNAEDNFYLLALTNDGGSIAAGNSNSPESGDKSDPCFGLHDWWITKLDPTGQVIEWQRTIGNTLDEVLTSMQQTPDGGYLLGGHRFPSDYGLSDYRLVKLNAAGDQEWERVFGGGGDDFLYTVEPTLDGGWLLGGRSNSGISGIKDELNYGGFDYWVLKVDATAETIEWQETLNGDMDDYLFDVEPTADGGYLLAGKSASNITADKAENSLGGDDFWVVRIDSDGDIVWQNTLGGEGFDAAVCVHETPLGGCWVGGTSSSPQSADKYEDAHAEDYWVMELNALGEQIWESTIGGAGTDAMIWMEPASEGGLFLGGFSDSGISFDKNDTCRGGLDYWIVHVASQGDTVWQSTIGGTGEDLMYHFQEHDGNLLLGGRSSSNASAEKAENSMGGVDHWILDIDPYLVTAAPDILEYGGLQLYPNPANKTMTIQLSSEMDVIGPFEVRDASGRQVPTHVIRLTLQNAAVVSLEVDVASLTAGAYFVTLQGEMWQAHGRFIKE